MDRDFDASTRNDTLSRASEFQGKDYFAKNKKSGLYQSFNPFTGQLEEQGNYSYGEPVGFWRTIDQDGDQQHFQYSSERVGAICHDGSRSSATGRGACSWHGGVAQWIHKSVKNKVGGTGKYQSVQSKTARAKKIIKQKFKLNQTGNQLQYQLTLLILQLDDKNQKLQKSNTKIKNQSQKLKSELKRTKQELEQQKKSKKQLLLKKQQRSTDNSKNQKQTQKVGKVKVIKSFLKEDQEDKRQENQEEEFKSIIHGNQKELNSSEESLSQLQMKINSDYSQIQSDNQQEDQEDYYPEVKPEKNDSKNNDLIYKNKKLQEEQQKTKRKEIVQFGKKNIAKTEQKAKKDRNLGSEEQDQDDQDDCDISKAVIRQMQKQFSELKK